MKRARRRRSTPEAPVRYQQQRSSRHSRKKQSQLDPSAAPGGAALTPVGEAPHHADGNEVAGAEAAGTAKPFPTEAHGGVQGAHWPSLSSRALPGVPRSLPSTSQPLRPWRTIVPMVEPPQRCCPRPRPRQVVPSDRRAFHRDAGPTRLFGHHVHPAGGGFQVEDGPSQFLCGLSPPAQASVMSGPQGRPTDPGTSSPP